MQKFSAGLLVFRKSHDLLEVFLVHPGGPLWANKDEGAWSLPKGEYTAHEDPLDAAKREFQEETGFSVQGAFHPLGEIVQAGGKHVTAWAVEMDVDASSIRSNTFKLEWPPKSGKVREFPEVDRAGWFSLAEARRKILQSQESFLDRLAERLGIKTVDRS
jgi:predicted NUDIX family NTP pyrophosphohydrolase